MNSSSNSKKTESKFLNAIIYFIVIITVAMVAPLVYKFADDYSNSRISSQGSKEIVNEKNTKIRKYTIVENTINISGLRDTESGALNLITAKITDSGDIILFCSSRVEITPPVIPVVIIDEDEDENKNDNGAESGAQSITQEKEKEYETILRIAAVKNIKNAENIIDRIDNNDNSGAPTKIETAGDIEVYTRAIRYNFLESLQAEDYIFKDFSDGTFFMSNSKSAFLFDINSMKIINSYSYPQNYHVYNTALSNSKETFALATEEGFYVSAVNAYMGIESSNMKEIIAPVNINGVSQSARYPIWSNNDERIYYKLYADNYVRYAGVTTPSPGGNEQLTALDCNNFLFLNDDLIFYYFPPGTEANPGNTFRCGYFNVSDKKMTEVMKSQIYYFDIGVSSNGNHLAALSYNGTMIKISVIDIRTKKLIYSSLYNEIYDFSFSPDEKNIIIYGRADNRRTLKVINIDWTEE
ncbi:MAG: hypothetical protein FWF92_01085 [Oscillospiraceae bacterium]|nr:hypothetical protein [Oscillospiraceae bacterium]